ncbi:facilitated trehalose transporter Tret1-like [Macrosteles quadrilineatus]|uniref:facilitated trehalose transporter Tret1-like n=1 Tax=Macrosteles quadrilineatus TaxID=74068 RepID=UPI0023E1CA74|nr:facilitated trehalose transporter Tret1-like [Macrosteles quadrilineatus]
MLVSWSLVTFSSSVWGLYVGRVLAGLGVGLISVAAPMYISDVAEDSVRGTLGTFFQLQMTVGVLFVYLVGLLKDALSISLVCSSLPLVFICTFVWMPETPSFLLSKGKDKAAAEALQWLRGYHYNIQPELSVLREVVRANGNSKGSSLGELLSDPANTRALVVTLGLMAFQQLSAVNAVIFYSQPIFEAVGSSIDPTVSTIVIGGVQVLATYTSTVLIERAGRRGLLLLSSATMSLCLGLVGMHFLLHDQNVYLPAALPLAFLAVFIFVFSLGFGPVPWLLTGELFPDSLKGLAGSFAASASWLLAFNVTFFFNVLKSDIGYGSTFCIFSGFCVMATVFVGLFLPETKGYSLEAIQHSLRGEKILDQDKLPSTDTLSRLL